MASILGIAWKGYNILFNELPDERTKTWFLTAKPYQGLTVLGLYLMFILKWGPQFMKGRPAYNLDKIMIVYNFLQVVACIYIFYYSLVLAWGWDYKWICEPVDCSRSEKAMGIAKTTYLYFIMKLVDLLDTVFFVLRKKYRQISFLHIYHHTGMVMLVWGAVTYLPGGHGTLIGVINTFVHIIMYSYYLYTVVNPSAKQSLWWKKYITQLQIAQFFWCVCHMLAIVFKPDCEYPRWTSAVFLPQNLFILILFIDFYIKTYIRKPKEQKIYEIKKKHAVTNGDVQKNGLCENGAKNPSNELKVLNEAIKSLKNYACGADNLYLQNGTSIPNVMHILNKKTSQNRSSLNEFNSPNETIDDSFHFVNLINCETNIPNHGRIKLNGSQSLDIVSRGTSSIDKSRNHGKVE